MKYFCLLMYLFALLSCSKHQDRSKELSTVQIAFDNFDPLSQKRFVNLETIGTEPVEAIQLEISDDGLVTFSDSIAKVSELVCTYEGFAFSLLITPGANISVRLDPRELMATSGIKKIYVDGDFARANLEILLSTRFMDSLHRSSGQLIGTDRTLVEFRDLRIRAMQSDLKNLRQFSRNQGFAQPEFLQWANAKIVYSAGTDLALYPYHGRQNNDLDLADEYFDFLKSIPVENRGQTTFRSYHQYLDQLTTMSRIMANVSAKHARQRNKLKSQGSSSFPIMFGLVEQIGTGNARAVMMTNLFRGEYDARKSNIPDSYKQKIFAYSPGFTYDKEDQDILNLLESYNLSADEKSELIALYSNTRGKAVFHDFWALNCAPCMRELPRYNSLVDLAQDDAVFVSMGVGMPHDEWAATVKKFDLKGINILLSKNQLAFFEKYFGLRGLPHHHIVNSRGKIIDGHLPHISQQNIPYIAKIIKEHSGILQ